MCRVPENKKITIKQIVADQHMYLLIKLYQPVSHFNKNGNCPISLDDNSRYP